MIDRLLDLFRTSEPTVLVAPALRALGVEDATDLAIVEFFIFDRRPAGKLRPFVAAWPWVSGLGKAALATEAEEKARLERLVARGALERAGGRYQVAEPLLRLFPGYPRARPAPGAEADAEDAAPPRGALDLARALSELSPPPAAADAPSATLADGLLALARLLAPLSAPDRASVEADLAGMGAPARRIAAALVTSALERPEGALSAALAAALEGALATLAPLADAAEGPRPLDALRLLILRFADAVAVDLDPDWLLAAGATVNAPRREELCRRFARWAGLDILRAGEREAPLAQLAGLLACDHRRERLFAEEEAHRARLAAEEVRLAADRKKRLDAQADAYASGRRE